MTPLRFVLWPRSVNALSNYWMPLMVGYVPSFSIEMCRVLILVAQLRASYTIVDHRERQIAPHSLAFNLTAQKFVVWTLDVRRCEMILFPRLYCGFENAIEVFDVSQPGEGTRIHTTPSKKSKDGLKGKSPPSGINYCLIL